MIYFKIFIFACFTFVIFTTLFYKDMEKFIETYKRGKAIPCAILTINYGNNKINPFWKIVVDEKVPEYFENITLDGNKIGIGIKYYSGVK